MQTVLDKLNLTPDEFNAMYTNVPVDGVRGLDVFYALCQRFGLDPLEPVGAQLADRGILTADEAEWMDEAE